MTSHRIAFLFVVAGVLSTACSGSTETELPASHGGAGGGDASVGGGAGSAGTGGGAGANAGAAGQGGTSMGGAAGSTGGAAGSGGSAAGSAGAAGAAGGAGGSAGTGVGGSGGGPSDCTLHSGIAGCDPCIQTNCLSSCQTCAANAECVALVACALGCSPNDMNCVSNCANQHPDGVSDAMPFAGPGGCVPTHCQTQCTPGTSTCSFSSGVPACDSCVQSSCLASCTQCTSNPECVLLVQCALQCSPNDQSCISQCASQHPNGLNDASAFAGPGGCVSTNCGPQCGQTPTCALQVGDPQCDACINTNCLQQCQTCSGNPECVALVQCGLQCTPGDMNCLNQCATQHPNGLNDAMAFAAPGSGCLDTYCSVPCQN